MIEICTEKEIYFSQYEDFQKRSGKKQPGWLQSLRQKGLDFFERRGFPSVHEEEWRFTNPAPLIRTNFESASDKTDWGDSLTPRQDLLGDWAGCHLVFINGKFSRSLSLLGKLNRMIHVSSFSLALKQSPDSMERHLGARIDLSENAFAALNTAFIEDGAFISIPRGVVIEEPISIIHVSSPDSFPMVSHPRNLIILEDSSQAKIVETYWGADSTYFTNAVTEVVLGENANLEHYKLQREGTKAYHLATLQFQLSRDSRLKTHSITLGGGFSRNDLNVILDGEGGEATLNGFYYVDGSRLADNHTRIYHNQPHCSSHELYKGILDGQARAVFNGRIYVRQGAQKTDAKQTNKNLILSEEALVNTNPQLEIYADDVKCTHGATIGQLDADVIFYLRSRGIGLDAARELLTYAFASDITSRLSIPSIRAELENHLFRQLASDQQSLEGL